jgi:hypothetical protein
MPAFLPRVIPGGWRYQGSNILLKQFFASLLLLSTLIDEVISPKQDGGGFEVVFVL